MDIQAIENAIHILENETATFNNVQELAYLYIVKDNLPDISSTMTTGVLSELNDILPQYKKYIQTKTKYQLDGDNYDKVLSSFRLLCQELAEFIEILYSSSDSYRERKLLIDTLQKLSHKYSE